MTSTATTSTPASNVHKWRTMFLAGAVLTHNVHILVDTSATHNILDINFSWLAGLMEQCINTMILMHSDNEIAYWGACFNMPLQIDSETFQIDALLWDLGINVDIILGTPWMADLDNIL